jgi:putative membrane protein
MWWHHFFGGGWGVVGGIFMIVLWAGLIALLVWGVMKISKSGGGGESKKEPMDIAKERYAKGEITKEEFEQIKKDLK